MDTTLVDNWSQSFEPKWLKSGKSFYFLSNHLGSTQIFQYDLIENKVSQITEVNQNEHLVDFEIAPNEKFFITICQESSIDESRQMAYITSKLFYQSNGQGLIAENGKENTVCVNYLGTDKKIKLCKCYVGYGLRKAVSISPDSQSIFVERLLHPNDDLKTDTGVFEYRLSKDLGSVLSEKLFTKASLGIFGETTFSDDLRYIGVLGNSLAYRTSNQIKLYVYDTKKNFFIDLLKENDIQVTDFCVTDFQQKNTNSQLRWDKITKSFIFTVSQEESVCLYSANPRTLEVRQLTKFHGHIQDFDIRPGENEAILVISNPALPTALWQIDLADTKKIQLEVPATVANSNFEFANYYRYEFRHPDGGRIPCLLVLPANYTKDRKIPLIVNIHGGPYAMHGYTFNHEVQVMASAGFAILLINPRGSVGYGQYHLNGVVGKYGEKDYEDIMIATKEVIKNCEFIDKNNLFVTGGSYGGFMTNWIVTQTNIFKKAVTQRSMSNFVSMFGTSDIGASFFSEENSGSDILHPQKLWGKSPLAHVRGVRTPMLIIQSDHDLRCPIEQAEQWYTALKYQHVPVKFIRIFNENHELSRSGTPSRRVFRLEQIMECFTKRNYFSF